MRIGIDIDGTMNNLADVLRPLLKKHFNIKPIIDAYNLFGEMTQMQIDKFERDFKHVFIEDVKPLKNVQNVIHKLSNDGHVIFIITARSAEKNLYSTLEWFRLNNFNLNDFDCFCFDNFSKVETCINNQIDLMIEDCPKHLKELWINQIDTIKFNHPYNAGIASTYSANNWDEIYDIIR